MFRELNLNPDKKRVGDCVIRAIAYALQCTWEHAYIELMIEGFTEYDMPSSNMVWDSYLRKHGFYRYVVPNSCPECYTVKDFCKEHNEGVYILATGTHVLVAQTAITGAVTSLSEQLANCCCENRAATQDVKYTIATEACNTRAANAANTQAILDKLCQLELDGFKRENDQLRSQLQFANLQASQVAQTAELRTAAQTANANLMNELRSCPIPAQAVYGNQPVFTCGAQTNCGCGSF